MTFFDSPLGEQLAGSLDSGKPEDIAGTVAAIEEKVWAGALAADQVDEVLARLQRHRQIQHVIDLADAATAVISRNRNRKDKRLWTDKAGGARIRYMRAGDEIEEADFITRTARESERQRPDAMLAILFLLGSALAQTPGEIQSRAQELYARGDLAEARRLLESLVASEPGFAPARFQLAAVYLRLERFDEAAKNAKLPRDALFMRYEAALARARAGDVARGRQELLEIARAQPPNAYSAQAAFKAAELGADADRARSFTELEAVMTDFPESGVAQVALHRLLRKDDEEGPTKASPAASIQPSSCARGRRPRCSARSDSSSQPSPPGSRCAASPSRKPRSMALSGS